MNGSLNNLKLDPRMLEALYGHSLVDNPHVVKQADTKKQRAKTEAFNYTGDNKKNITILVRGNGDPLPEEQISFLEKMLKACKLEASDVAMVNVQNKNIAMEDLVARLKPQQVLAFGTGSGSELFRMENVDGIKYLNAPSLDELMKESDSSRQLKARLWNELKSIFGLQ
jgi:hypothetical protein